MWIHRLKAFDSRSWFRSRRYRSREAIGFWKLKSNPNLYKIAYSSVIKASLSTIFFSFSESRLTIRLKLGEIGYSSFAASNTDIVARVMTFSFGNLSMPIACR